MSKQLKSRNAIASFVKTIRPQVIPDKRQRKIERLDRESAQHVICEPWRW